MFEEVEYGPNQLLEIEGTMPRYMYLILLGDVTLFKRPESLYTKDGKKIKTDNIECW